MTIAPLTSDPTRAALLAGLLRAERIKATSLRTLRTASVLVVLAPAAFTALMALGVGMAELDGGTSVGELVAATFGPHPVAGAVGYALLVSQALVGVLAALLVSTEAGTGGFAISVAAVPDRRAHVFAKVLTAADLAAALGLLGALASVAIAAPVFAANGFAESLLAPALVQTVLGGALGLALVAALAAALALLVRSSAAAVGLVLGVLLVAPGVTQLVPVVGSAVTVALPSSLAGLLAGAPDPALAALGGAGLLAWAAIAVSVATARFARREL